MSPRRFFVTTIVASWVLWMPLLLIHLGLLPPVVPLGSLTAVALLGVLVPAAAASVLTTRAGGRGALRDLWGRLLRWRVGRWWLPVLVLQPMVLATTAALWNLAGGADPVRPAAALGIGSLGTQVVFLVIAATGEEVGWRGLALPALQQRGGAVRASVVLGLVTATWHLPYWLLQGVLEDFGWWYLAVDYVFVLALTVQLTWLVNRTGGSVLVAVVFHVVFNAVNVALLPVTASGGAFALLTGIEVVIALVLLRRLEPRGAGQATRTSAAASSATRPSGASDASRAGSSGRSRDRAPSSERRSKNGCTSGQTA